jgi:hypothetical protein
MKLSSRLSANRESAMHPAVDISNQNFFAVIGSAYVSEHHIDEAHRYLPFSDRRVVNFDEVLKALRAALSLR